MVAAVVAILGLTIEGAEFAIVVTIIVPVSTEVAIEIAALVAVAVSIATSTPVATTALTYIVVPIVLSWNLPSVLARIPASILERVLTFAPESITSSILERVLIAIILETTLVGSIGRILISSALKMIDIREIGLRHVAGCASHFLVASNDHDVDILDGIVEHKWHRLATDTHPPTIQ